MVPHTGGRRWRRLAVRALDLAESEPGHRIVLSRRVRVVVSAAAAVLLLGTATAVVVRAGGPVPAGAVTLSAAGAAGTTGMGELAAQPMSTTTADLAPATSAPAPASPATLAAPLGTHQVFAFAPYWSLPDSASIDVTGLTTLAYFSLGVNPDGTLDESGPGWTGYESQALSDLVTRAHAAGDRVVLTVNCFDQGALDQLTSSPAAAETLATALVAAIAAKRMDGVNLDLEGEGSADQAGLTALVARVSRTLHAANPRWLVSMDTYASAAGDPSGFYDIPALAPYVDQFFVMAYQLNYGAPGGGDSPLTSSMFSDTATVAQYAAAVPAAKVILGTPFFGEDWPTTDGTLQAQATGAPSTPSVADIEAGGHPAYWDPVTDTAWTSYEVGTQWHEAFFEDAASLSMVAALAQRAGLAGVGIWALGMQGDDASLLAALDGAGSVVKPGSAGPSATSLSVAPPEPSGVTASTRAPRAPRPARSTTTTTAPGAPAGATPGASGGTAPATAPSTTTTVPAGPVATATLGGTTVSLSLRAGHRRAGPNAVEIGTLTGFATGDPALTCLAGDGPIAAYVVRGNSSVAYAFATAPADCVSATLTFTPPGTVAGPAAVTSTTLGGRARPG